MAFFANPVLKLSETVQMEYLDGKSAFFEIFMKIPSLPATDAGVGV
jgi:hypothetical protein